MAKKSNGAKGTYFTVGKSSKKEVFRDVHTGKFVTHVMSERVYEKATGRAGRKIREYASERKAS